jgi:hypothetical protein
MTGLEIKYIKYFLLYLCIALLFSHCLFPRVSAGVGCNGKPLEKMQQTMMHLFRHIWRKNSVTVLNISFRKHLKKCFKLFAPFVVSQRSSNSTKSSFILSLQGYLFITIVLASEETPVVLSKKMERTLSYV